MIEVVPDTSGRRLEDFLRWRVIEVVPDTSGR
jgi:hypothetical protein